MKNKTKAEKLKDKDRKDREEIAKNGIPSLEQRLKGKTVSPHVPFHLPTGIHLLDVACTGSREVRGIPSGRITLLQGPTESGKSEIAYYIGASAIEQGGQCVLIDSEIRFNASLASKVGLDPDGAGFFRIVCQGGLEEAINTLQEVIKDRCDLHDQMMKAGEGAPPPLVLIVDSIASLGPDGEAALDAGEVRPLLMAQLWAKFLRSPRYYHRIVDKNIYLVLLNQQRENIDFTVSFGPKQSRNPGGRSIKYAASIILSTNKKSMQMSAKEKAAIPKGTSEGVDLSFKIEKANEFLPDITVPCVHFHRAGIDNFRSMWQFLADDGFQKFMKVKSLVKDLKSGRFTWKDKREGKSFFADNWEDYFAAPENMDDFEEFIADAEEGFLAYCRYSANG